MLTLNAPGNRIQNGIIDGLESVMQRVNQHLHYWSRTWFLNARGGLPYQTILGHNIDVEIVRKIIVSAILEVQDVTNVTDVHVELNPQTRRMDFFGKVHTTFGDFEIEESPTETETVYKTKELDLLYNQIRNSLIGQLDYMFFKHAGNNNTIFLRPVYHGRSNNDLEDIITRWIRQTSSSSSPVNIYDLSIDVQEDKSVSIGGIITTDLGNISLKLLISDIIETALPVA